MIYYDFTQSEEIKQQMEKDVDEVGKIARSIKSKIEVLDKEVRLNAMCLDKVWLQGYFLLPTFVFLLLSRT